MATFRSTFFALLLPLLLSACSTSVPSGLHPITPFELNRYLGQWYEIARLDHSFERGMSDVNATYQLLDDGSVKVINRGYNTQRQAWKEAIGRALFIGDPATASLKVSFFGPFYGGYHVIALDPDYRWSLVAGPDRDYLWILARDKTLPVEVREQLLSQAKALGFATDKLIWVEQTRSDTN
ncbi:lipocalin family protein [Dechloromonas denitrificans]|uniref:lipocalin family protein n=1 Tax=Dechloromonas denitrificans TaxID=281362 RepID=UPI001CF82AD9|nr:lipocalin family protein [Dechloromonas denitrificans]UCV12475.1 lipocalin family protein [Dechloromonas denitrificans]